jgi:hypothetical protein
MFHHLMEHQDHHPEDGLLAVVEVDNILNIQMLVVLLQMVVVGHQEVQHNPQEVLLEHQLSPILAVVEEAVVVPLMHILEMVRQVLVESLLSKLPLMF